GPGPHPSAAHQSSAKVTPPQVGHTVRVPPSGGGPSTLKGAATLACPTVALLALADAGHDPVRLFVGDRDHVVGEIATFVGMQQRATAPLKVGTEGFVPLPVVGLDSAEHTTGLFPATEVVDDCVVANLFGHGVSPVGSLRIPSHPVESGFR